MSKKLTFFMITVLLCFFIANICLARQKEKNPIDVIIATSKVNPDADKLKDIKLSGLKYMGSILMACSHPAFGGFSELMVTPDGKKFLSVSDMGFWITGTLTYDKNGQLAGIERQARLGRLLSTAGKPFSIKYRADSEAFCRAPNSGFLVAFERKHRINKYPGNDYDLSGVPTRYDFPPFFKNLPENGGIESMMKLSDGRILIITEGAPEDGGISPCAIGTPDNWESFTYKRKGSFRPTSVAAIPGDRLLLLERSYTGPGSLKIRFATIRMKDISKGAQIESKLLSNLTQPLPLDNFEGLDTRTTSDSRTFIYIISDDNFSPFQHTLIMMFELK